MSDQLEPYRSSGSVPQGQGGWAPVGAVGHQTGPVLVTNQNPNTAIIVIAWVLTVVSLGYFLPWAIAASRGKSNQGAIGLINFLAGWSVVGWVVALVMACGAHQAVYIGGTHVNVMVAQPGYVPYPNSSAFGSAAGSDAYQPQRPMRDAARPVDAPLPPAGWFADPEGHGQRYWDGQSWTDQRIP